jgi:hypothetical protein
MASMWFASIPFRYEHIDEAALVLKELDDCIEDSVVQFHCRNAPAVISRLLRGVPTT